MPKPSAQKISADDPSLLPSDDEDDDFVPSGAGAEDSGSESESDSDEEGGGGKRKGKGQEKEVEVVPTMTKEAVDDLWASFNATDDDPYASFTAATTTTTTGNGKKEDKKERKKIKITVEYQFVGETVLQEKEVWEDSDEAKVWREKQRSLPPPPAPATSVDALFGEESIAPSTSTSTSIAPTSTSTSIAPTSAPSIPPPPPAGPPKKRKAGGLDSMAASLGVKATKLNTLEKSKLDWNKYVHQNTLEDDLTKARKDGYLEKQDFLRRTEERREEGWEKGRGGRR